MSSWTRTYSRHCDGFFASSRFNQMRRASELHVPHRVFIFLMPHSAIRKSRIPCHFSTSGGINSFNRWRYHRRKTISRWRTFVPGRTDSSMSFFRVNTFGVPCCGITERRYWLTPSAVRRGRHSSDVFNKPTKLSAPRFCKGRNIAACEGLTACASPERG